MRGQRIAYACPKCSNRVFLDAVPRPAPSCGQHGRMVHQVNRPYKGTKPLSEVKS